MRNVPIYELRMTEAMRLADLCSVASDLKQVKSFLLKSLERKDDEVLSAALFSASLITYRRCFNSGVRDALDRDDVVALPDNAIALHDYLYEQASKLIAHSVNAFERTLIGAVVDGETVVGVAELSARLTSFQEADIGQWIRLVDMIAQQILVPRMELARAAVETAAKLLPISELKKAPIMTFTAPGPEDAGKKRS